VRQPRIPKDTPPHQRKPQPWVRSRRHLDFVASLCCLGCGRRGPCGAAHVRIGNNGATGRKPSDDRTVPLCMSTGWREGCHTRQHRIGERTFYAELMDAGITDPWSVATRLWTISGNLELGYRAIQHARPGLPTAVMI
jgi:hypothetical protein